MDQQILIISYSKSINQFIYLFNFIKYIENQDEQILTWTEKIVAGTQQRYPTFDKTITIGKTDEVICQSSTILDTSHQLIDCHHVNDQEPQTYFYMISENDAQQELKIENVYPYEKIQQRYNKYKYYVLLYILSTEQYIYRITLKTNNNPAIIELFSYDLQTKGIKLVQTINQELIQQYVNITQYSFDMVDAKISPSDQIVILDKTGNVFSLNYYSSNDTWKFYQQGYLLGESISFDYQFNNQDFAILQKQSIKLKYQTYESQEDLSNSKLHFTNNFLFLTSTTQILYFDKNLNLIYNIAGDFSNVMTDQNQNDFLAFTNTNIKNYLSHSQYRIQYHNNEQGITGNSKITLNACQVTIQYQTVSTNSVDLILISKGNIYDYSFFTERNFYHDFIIPPRKLVSGPKQKIAFTQGAKDNVQAGGNLTYIAISGDLEEKYTNKNLTLTDLIFVQTVSMAQSFDQPYAIITQNKQKQLTIYYCYTLQSELCIQSYQVKLDFEITQYNTIVEYNFIYFFRLLDIIFIKIQIYFNIQSLMNP